MHPGYDASHNRAGNFFASYSDAVDERMPERKASFGGSEFFNYDAPPWETLCLNDPINNVDYLGLATIPTTTPQSEKRLRKMLLIASAMNGSFRYGDAPTREQLGISRYTKIKRYNIGPSLLDPYTDDEIDEVMKLFHGQIGGGSRLALTTPTPGALEASRQQMTDQQTAHQAHLLRSSWMLGAPVMDDESTVRMGSANMNIFMSALAGEGALFAAGKAVQGLRTLHIARTGGTGLNQARAINAIGTELRAGALLNQSPLVSTAAGNTFTYNMVTNPGPLALLRNNPAANFAGGRYNAITLTEDIILYRGGKAGGGRNAYGQWFTDSAPPSAAHVHIDSAVKRFWTHPRTGVLTGESPVEAVYALRIPKGTTIYQGPVGYQGGISVGGGNQIFVPEPWAIKGVKVLSEKSLP